jgi:hypothetical protein
LEGGNEEELSGGRGQEEDQDGGNKSEGEGWPVREVLGCQVSGFVAACE